MRKTKPEDFDPNYKPSKSTGPKPEELDMEGVVPIKPKPATADAKEDSGKVTERESDPDRTTVRPNDRTTDRKRSTKRHAFEIYRDQLEQLKRLKAMAMLDGHETSMSEMVRDALDTYLEPRREE